MSAGRYTITAHCPACPDAGLVYVNGRANGLLTVAVLACPECSREWEVTARIIPHGRDGTAAERKRDQRARHRAQPGSGAVASARGRT